MQNKLMLVNTVISSQSFPTRKLVVESHEIIHIRLHLVTVRTPSEACSSLSVGVATAAFCTGSSQAVACCVCHSSFQVAQGGDSILIGHHSDSVSL